MIISQYRQIGNKQKRQRRRWTVDKKSLGKCMACSMPRFDTHAAMHTKRYRIVRTKQYCIQKHEVQTNSESEKSESMYIELSTNSSTKPCCSLYNTILVRPGHRRFVRVNALERLVQPNGTRCNVTGLIRKHKEHFFIRATLQDTAQ